MTKKIKRKIVIDSLLTILKSGIGQILQTLRGFLIAKFLGPAYLGIWSNLSIIFNYASNLHLGTLQILSRDLPKELSRKNEKKSQEIIDYTFTFIMMVGLFFILAMVIYTVIFYKKYSYIFNLGLVTIGILVLLQLIFRVMTNTIRAFDDFKKLTIIGIVFSVLNLITAAVLVYFWKLKGIYLAVMLTYSIILVITWFMKPYKIHLNFDIKSIIRIIKPGLALMLISFLYMFIRSIDKIFILLFLDHNELGLYHFSIMITSFVVIIPQAVAGQMFPKLSFRSGQIEDFKLMFNYVFKPTLGLSYLVLLLTGYGFIIIPFLIKLIMPEYNSSISPFLIIFFGLFLLAISGVAGNFLLVIERQIDIIKVYIIALIFCILSDYILLKLGYGIIGVAIGTSITYFIYGVGVLWFGLKYVTKNKKQLFFYFFKISFPFLLFLVGLFVVFFIENFIKYSGFFIYIQRIIIFSMVAIPFVLYYYFNSYRKEFK